MNCPDAAQLDLLAMDALADDEAARLRRHVETCPTCRPAFEAARRKHFERVRMYDQFDRDHDALREQLMAALPSEPDRLSTAPLARAGRRLGEWTMALTNRSSGRTALAGLAVAACLVLGVFLFVSAGQQNAFAAAIEQFQRARTIVCSISSPTVMDFGGQEFTPSGKLYISDEYGTRAEAYGNGILSTVQYTPVEGPITSVNPPGRTYMVIENAGASDNTKDTAQPSAFILALCRLTVDADRELGRKTIDGLEAEGFEITGKTLGMGNEPDARSELWIDVATGLPLRYIVERPGFRPDTTLTLIYEDFEWDVPLDPSLFKPDIPEDFKRLDATIPTLDEDALLNGLELFAELTGKYPTTLSMPGVVRELGTIIGARAASGQEIDQEKLSQQSIDIGAACVFYATLNRDGYAPEYFGETVTPDMPDEVLIRWRLPNGDCRTIYGNLDTEDTKCP